MTGNVSELYDDLAFGAAATYLTGGVAFTATKASNLIPGTVQISSLGSGITMLAVQASENGGTAGTAPGQFKVQCFWPGAGTAPAIEVANGSTFVASQKFRASYLGN